MSAQVDDPPAVDEAPQRAPLPMPSLPRAKRPEAAPRDRHLRRRVVRSLLIATVCLFAWLTFDAVLAPLLHEQRQHHSAAEYREPSPNIRSGDPIAIVQVPTLGINEVVLEGVSVEHLRGGPAHWSGSALPGDVGVMVVLGHRDAYGGPFERIGTMKQGDSIVARARNGGPIVRYVVDRVERGVTLDKLDLQQTDLVSYLLLGTSEGRFGEELTVVVARALPVTDSDPIVPDLAVDPRPAPVGLETLLALGSLAIAVLAFQHLGRRAATVVRLLVIAPPACYGIVRLLMAFDSVFALAR